MLSFIFLFSLRMIGYGQDFNGYISKLFLTDSIDVRDTGIVNYFKQHKDLVFSRSVKMPDMAKADPTEPGNLYAHVFSYTKHPYFDTELFKGGLTINTIESSGQKKITNIFLQFVPRKEKDAMKCLEKLDKELTALGLSRTDREKREPSIDFIESKSGARLTITKGTYPPTINEGRSFVVVMLEFDPK